MQKGFSDEVKVWYDAVGGDALGLTLGKASSKKRKHDGSTEESKDLSNMLKTIGEVGKGLVRSIHLSSHPYAVSESDSQSAVDPTPPFFISPSLTCNITIFAVSQCHCLEPVAAARQGTPPVDPPTPSPFSLFLRRETPAAPQKQSKPPAILH
ncbi:hypothetical protein FXO37_20470 [Capsicum annuum]|nr:hypothetical protein FXO37_20470 [Capsicum annuum]